MIYDPDVLRMRRLQVGLNQKQLAEKIGVTPSTVCYWENGRSKPSPENRSALREALE